MGKNQHQPNTMTIRFSARDGELQLWLSQFASTYDMSKVVKLACYLLAGLQPDEGLLALLAQIKGTTASTPSKPTNQESSSDGLASIMQELTLLRQTVMQQTTQHHAKPAAPAAPEPVIASSGLDMNRPRKKNGPPKVLDSTPNIPPALSPEELSRQLLKSIRGYHK